MFGKGPEIVALFATVYKWSQISLVIRH